MRTEDLGEHQGVAHRLEVSLGLEEQVACRLGLSQLQVCAGDVEPDGSEAVSRRPEAQQLFAIFDRVRVAHVRKQRFELEQPVLRLVGHSRGIGEEELDRLPSAERDVLESRQRRSRAAGLDEEDRRGGDVSLAHLGEAQPGLLARLLDRSRAQVYPRQPFAF